MLFLTWPVKMTYLLIIEKPANPFLPNGLDGEVLSVYTENEYRGKGICTTADEEHDISGYEVESFISLIKWPSGATGIQGSSPV